MGFRFYVKPYGGLIIPAPCSRHGSTAYHTPISKDSNILSDNTKRKIRNAISWLDACSTEQKIYVKKLKKTVKWRINIATLTFPNNMQDDKKAVQMLSRWLEMAKYRFNMTTYVWKAEPQERGSIHFHFSTNVYIPFRELNYTWNRELFKNGFDGTHSNSTDIQPIINVRNMQGYLSEYYLNEKKHDGRRQIQCRKWGCSHNLSNAGKDYVYIDDNEAASWFSELSKWKMEFKSQSYANVYKFNHTGYFKSLLNEAIIQINGVTKQKQLWPRQE